MAGFVSLTVDPDGRTIRVAQSGTLTVEMVRAHFTKLEAVMHEMRCRFGAAKVLVDIGDALVQPPEVAAIISESTSRMYAPDDRVALLCHSMLQTLQNRRSGPQGRMKEFLHASEAEAIEWLHGNQPATKADDRRASSA